VPDPRPRLEEYFDGRPLLVAPHGPQRMPPPSITLSPPRGVEVLAPEARHEGQRLGREHGGRLGPHARRFEGRRRELCAARAERQRRLDAGERPDFPPETAALRAGAWRVAPPPPEIADRRVEITGPVDRKMIINALNSGACVFMADFEDSNAPALVLAIVAEETDAVRASMGPERFAAGRDDRARSLFAALSTADRFEEFLTLPAYDLIVTRGT
jgi:malate synthase